MLLFLILSIILVIIISVYYFKIEKCKDRYTVLKSKINENIIRNTEMNNRLDSINNSKPKKLDKKVLQKDRLEDFQISENENSEEEETHSNIIESENSLEIPNTMNDNIDQDSKILIPSCDKNPNIETEHNDNSNIIPRVEIHDAPMKPIINDESKPTPEIRPNTKPEITPEIKPEITPNTMPEIRPVLNLEYEHKPNLLPEIKYRPKNNNSSVGMMDISCLVLDKPYINNEDNTIKPYTDQVYSSYSSNPISNLDSSKHIEFFKSDRLCQNISIKEIEVPCGTPVLPKSVSYSECEPCPLNEYTPESHPLEVKEPPSMCESPHINDFYIRELDKDNEKDKESDPKEEVSLYDTVFNETKSEVHHEDIMVRSNYKNNKLDYSGTDFIFHNDNISQNLYNR